MLKIKDLEDSLSESLIESLLWSYVYVPENVIEVGTSQENIWFGGYVVGYEVSKIYHDFDAQKDVEECKVSYNLVLSDGACFPLSKKSEVFTVTENEFTEMLSEYAVRSVEDAKDNGTWGGENQGTLWSSKESGTEIGQQGI